MVLLLLVSACGGGTPPDDGPTGGPVSPATTLPTTSTPTNDSGPRSLLRRHDTPPEGVRQQFEFFQEGNGVCFGTDSITPFITTDGLPAIATRYFVCFHGFAADTPVDVQIERPDGAVRTFHVETYTFDGVPFLELISLPADPLGPHTVTATQGSVLATGTFEVGLPENPRVLLVPPSEGPPGTTFQLAMAGFVPPGSVPLYLYRLSGPGTYEFLTTLPSANMGSDGTVLYSIVTLPRDPPGTYCIVHVVGAETPPEFCSALFDVEDSGG
jgi:hypothetical protein